MEQMTATAQNTDDEIRKNSESFATLAAALSELTSLVIRAPQISQYTIADLDWLVVPAVVNRQILIVRAPMPNSPIPLPSAAILWADVSDAIDAQFRANPGQRLKLTAEDRRSGDHTWITDLIGHPTLLKEAMQNLMATRFKGRAVSYSSRNAEGQDVIVDYRGP